MKTNLKLNQRGRSMVEMLGVLAIIGVLSVAGVSGYTTAMNKHRANEILNEANKRAVVVATKITVDQPIDGNTFSEFSTNTVSGATFGIPSYTKGNKIFIIPLNNVSKEICQQLKTILGNNGRMTFLEECSAPFTSLGLIFNTDLSPNVNPYDENKCPFDKPILASKGRCSACPSREKSMVSIGTVLSFSASSATDCQKCGDDYVFENGKCIVKDCPQGFWNDNGNCKNCESGWYSHNTDTNTRNSCLAACPNRSYASDGYGMGCTIPCPAPLIRDKWGQCLDCSGITGYWDKGNGTCSMCSGLNFVNVSYNDRCELLSDCPEGQHLGKCCEQGEVYHETSRVRNRKNSQTTYSSGICCPSTRPYLKDGKCSPEE